MDETQVQLLAPRLPGPKEGVTAPVPQGTKSWTRNPGDADHNLPGIQLEVDSMGFAYSNVISPKATSQQEPIPGREAEMAKNSAGGFSFSVDCWTQLDRFLVLGSEGGSYYASEQTLSKVNAKAVISAIKADGKRAVARIAQVSSEGRAPKNSPAVFALGLALTFGDDDTKRAAVEAVPAVVRTGTHAFELTEVLNELRGWGKTAKRAVRAFYESKTASQLSYQLSKYQQRNGWSHRDLFRLAHPRFTDETKNAAARWAVKGWDSVGEDPHPDEALRILWAFERAKRAGSAAEVVKLIRDYRLVREHVPTQFLNSPEVQEALLQHMPVTALVRNLGNLTKTGVVKPLSDGTRLVVEKLKNKDLLKAGRVHPMALLVAQKVYAQGHGEKGGNTWQPVQAVVDALDEAFYLAFDAVEPTGLRWMLSLDLSGSMGRGGVAGTSLLTPRQAAAAMALVTASVEKNSVVTGFTANGANPACFPGKSREGLDLAMSELAVSPRQRLSDVVKYTESFSAGAGWGSSSGYRFGGTDCSLPMRYAMEKRIAVDVFVIFTDSETYLGNVHPTQALQAYRKETGIPAKLVVVGMVANSFSIADPNDSGQLDCVGFSTDTPSVMSEFARG